MTANLSRLLRRLEPAVRPGPMAPIHRAPRPPLEAQSFDHLLMLVSKGRMRSDRSLGLKYEPTEAFTDEQMDRMAAAADLAEGHGAETALLLVDGRAVVLSVSNRELRDEMNSAADRLIDLDTAVYVAGPDDGAETGTVPWPGGGVLPQVVARQLLEKSGAANPAQFDQNSQSSRLAG